MDFDKFLNKDPVYLTLKQQVMDALHLRDRSKTTTNFDGYRNQPGTSLEVVVIKTPRIGNPIVTAAIKNDLEALGWRVVTDIHGTEITYRLTQTSVIKTGPLV